MKKVTIIGAGLAGTLLSLYIVQRGYEVDVYEARGDLRKVDEDGGRSINLALSCRGITSLNKLGLMPEVEKIMVPMRARAIHEENGEISYQPFGRHEEEYINAILRSQLNALLLNQTDAVPKINVYFDSKLTEIDLENKRLYFQDKQEIHQQASYDILIAADGAASNVREALSQAGHIDCTRDFLPHGYKELSITREHGAHMAREHLHLWPRDDFMLLGNPNQDDSITGSLFMPMEGENSFASLQDEETLKRFFKQAFADAYPAMPNLVGEFFTNPIGNLSTIKCSPWYYQDQCLLIGDAAHGIVPFFGQGMNCAFEDCRILNELLDQYHDDWSKVMPAFFTSRKANTDAVAAMSMDNYHEIQQKILEPKFNLKKELQFELMKRYPERYISKHVLVMFTNVPYEKAERIGQIQKDLLNEICMNIDTLGEVNWNKVDDLMREYDKKLSQMKS